MFRPSDEERPLRSSPLICQPGRLHWVDRFSLGAKPQLLLGTQLPGDLITPLHDAPKKLSDKTRQEKVRSIMERTFGAHAPSRTRQEDNA